MPTAMPLTTAIGQDSTRRVKQRLVSARFGDGYFQTAAEGVNSIFEEWDITWPNLTSTERDTVIAALLAGATDYLTWTPSGDSASKKYQVVPDKAAQLYTETNNGVLYTISTSVVQVR
jgi:phage-related protein